MKFKKGAGSNNLNFPITKVQLKKLKPCKLHSPMVGDAHGLTKDMIVQDSKELLEVVSMVNRGEYPYEFLAKYYPKAWGELPRELPQPLVNEGLSIDNPQGMANVRILKVVQTTAHFPPDIQRQLHQCQFF